MASRLDLHELLKSIMVGGFVYFQPPVNMQIKYPALIYKRDYAVSNFADDLPYVHTKRYMLTLIDRNPDTIYYDPISRLPTCIFVRNYSTDGLNHDIFNLYF